MRFPLNTNRRRGAIVPLFALLLIPLLAMLAFSIDAGWMVLCRTDLQNTADAAALAGAEKLQNLYVQYNMPGQLSQGTILARALTNSGPDSPMGTAEKFAALNKAGNVYITGETQSNDFPVTKTAFQRTKSGGIHSTEAFVTKIAFSP